MLPLQRDFHQPRSILDDLAMLPWWINVIFAVVVYLSLKFWIPSIAFQNPFYKGMAMAVPSFAPVASVLLLFVAAISAFNAWRKGQLLDRQKDIGTLRKISWQEFEELVGEAYRRKGYAVTENGGGGADGGVDLVLKRGGEILLVQCKHWKMDKVGVKIVRELYGVVAAEGATGGVVISSGTFTQEAQDFAKGKPIELLGGSELLNIIAEVQKPPTGAVLLERRSPTEVSTWQPALEKKSDSPRSVASGEMHPSPTSVNNKPNDNVCPICGVEMVLRTAKKGPKAGEQFWGCSAFPKCRATKPYSA
jgi:restriction system protein